MVYIYNGLTVWHGKCSTMIKDFRNICARISVLWFSLSPDTSYQYRSRRILFIPRAIIRRISRGRVNEIPNKGETWIVLSSWYNGLNYKHYFGSSKIWKDNKAYFESNAFQRDVVLYLVMRYITFIFQAL